MGWKYEVRWWVCDKGLRNFRDETVYTGEWLLVAVYYMLKGKRLKVGCIKLLWR